MNRVDAMPVAPTCWNRRVDTFSRLGQKVAGDGRACAVCQHLSSSSCLTTPSGPTALAPHSRVRFSPQPEKIRETMQRKLVYLIIFRISKVLAGTFRIDFHGIGHTHSDPTYELLVLWLVLHEPDQQRLLRMQPVFSLIEDHRLRTVDDGSSHLAITIGRKAVQEDRFLASTSHDGMASNNYGNP